MDEGISTGGAALARAEGLAEPLRTPAATYATRLREAFRAIEQLEKRSARLANLRGLAFIAAAALAASTFFGKLPEVGWYGAGAGIAVYAALALAHERVFQRKRRTQLLAELNERGIARLSGEWHRFKDRGDRFAHPDHLYAGDLDIFGQGSIFQLINETATRLGESVLAQWLASPTSADVVRQRQEAVLELAAAIDFRQTLLLECRLVTEEKADPSPFIAWAEGGPYLQSIGWAKTVAWLMPAATLALLIAGQLGWIAPYAWLVGILLSVGILRRVRGPLDAFYRRLAVGEMGFTRFERVFEAIARQSFADPLLQQLSTDLGGERVSLHLRRFARIFGFTEVAPQLRAVFNALFLWDIHWFFRLEGWRIELGGRVRRWFDSLAQLESLCSLAALAHDRPQFTFPELVPDGPVFVAGGLGHPLLDNPVRNDVEIPGPQHALIITGSNMSGKSTMLRAIGTNAVLALTGAPVCARSLKISGLDIFTSMRVRDSLELGVSHFYAEVQRIKAVLDGAAAANGRALFLLDEILWGTNTRERQIASREVLRLLLKTGASGAVSTHDLSLASLEQELGGRVKNFHFKDLLVDGRMTFDYRLRDGVLDTTNALRLLRLMGIAIEEKEPR